MRVTMVKKRLANGDACAKCVQAEQMLRGRGLWDRIDHVVWALEDDPSSVGMRLAATHDIDRAPFWLVEEEDGSTTIIASALKAAKRLAAMDAAPPPADPRDPAEDLADVVDRAARELSGADPQVILDWGLERFGDACGIAFSGAEDVALVDMATRSGKPFTVFCLDTGRLHAETHQFLDRVRRHYGLALELMSPSPERLEPFVRTKGLYSFYEDDHAECCGIRKLGPLRRALATRDAWVTGQRKDQSPATRSDIPVLQIDGAFRGRGGGPLVKLNPLAQWTSAQVWAYLREHDVPFNPLHLRGYKSIGCEPCTRAVHPGQHEREGRWWWEDATRKECGLHAK